MARPETLPQGFVIVVADESQAASASRPIFLASGANTWNPGDPDFQLSPRSDKRWQLVVEPGTFGENVEFKFTLGGWDTVETDADGQGVENRQFPAIDVSTIAAGEKPIIEFTIPRFQDGSEQFVIAEEYRPIRATGTVKRLQVAGGAGAAAGAMRDLLVWLPPGYSEDEARRYPVLYMLDGQHLYETRGTVAEWRLDETATGLITAGAVEPFIAVGIPSIPAARFAEYTPPEGGASVTYNGSRPMGDAFLAWMKTEAMPRVERAFRTKADPEHTAIGGASLGGLFALYASHAAADRFGMALIESPALAFRRGGADYSIMPWAAQAKNGPSRVFIGMGGAEHIDGSGFFDRDTKEHVKAAERLYEALSQRSEAALYIVDRHEHNESAWAERLAAALTHLFPPSSEASDDQSRALPTVPESADTVRIVVVDESGAASEARPIVMPGTHNNWNPGDPERRLGRVNGNTWTIDLPKPEVDAIEFKFALGSWDYVELDDAGNQIENRAIAPNDIAETAELRFVVPRFATPAPRDSRDFTDRSRPLDVTGRVERLAVFGGAGMANDAAFERDLLVWLPDAYDADRDPGYPVVFLLDGQNVFERPPGIPGEWHADETATALISAGSAEPFVIVAVPNSMANRAAEYIPPGLGKLRGVSPDGERFAVWLADVVVPRVREQFNITTDPTRTCIGGASLGGLMSVYAATTRPEVFGLVLIESCSMLGDGGRPILDHLSGLHASKAVDALPFRVAIGMGTHELGASTRDADRNERYVAWSLTLRDAFIRAGVPAPSVRLNVAEGHSHHEPAWAERFPDAITFLLAPR
jgi:predicted alpha/beta superfamily hydrolase